jgi:cell division protein FtsW
LILVLAFKIEREPDLGTAAVILSIMMILFWLGGVSSKSMKILVVFGMIATVGLMVLEPYRLDRITNHYHRWDEKNVDDIGFQTTQSETAMAGGGLAGVGIGAGRAKHIIPAPTTDFVMATIGEEFGLIGSLITILVMGALVFRLIYLSRTVHSETAKLILLGVAAWLGVQSCVNVIMANGTAPAIGIPFPFISSGGSSLIALWIAMGVCQACVINAPVKEKVRENSRNRRRYRGSRLSGARSR